MQSRRISVFSGKFQEKGAGYVQFRTIGLDRFFKDIGMNPLDQCLSLRLIHMFASRVFL